MMYSIEEIREKTDIIVERKFTKELLKIELAIVEAIKAPEYETIVDFEIIGALYTYMRRRNFQISIMYNKHSRIHWH